MNRDEFLDNLKKKLFEALYSKIEEKLIFYKQMIDARVKDGLSETDAIENIGSLDDVVAQIISEISDKDLAKKDFDKKELKPKRNLKAWEIILITLGFIVCTPFVLIAVAIIFAICVCIYSITFALLSVVISGLYGVFFYLTEGNFSGALFSVGLSTTCAGFVILLLLACIYFTKGIIKLSSKIFFGLKNLFCRESL